MSSAPSLVCELGEVYAGIYRVKSLLGKGGSAEVYLVEHTTVHKPFALKVLNRSSRVDDRSLQRFRTEGRALFEVNHPNVVRVFHAGEDAVLGPMIAMEVLEGKTLAQVLAMARSLPPARAIPPSTTPGRGLAEASRPCRDACSRRSVGMAILARGLAKVFGQHHDASSAPSTGGS